MAKVKVDIIILANSKNQKYIKMTQDCIDSILVSESNVEWNILVMESSPKSKPYKGATSTIAPNEKFNYNRFINYAIESNTLHAPYLTILNNDVICHKWWASALIEAIRDKQLDSACLKTRNWAPHVGLDESKAIHYGWNIGKEVTGWCWMFRRSSFDKLYPLDERFEFWCQDNDIALRMSLMGMKHALATSNSITHLLSQSHQTLDKDFRRMTDGMGLVYNRKWGQNGDKIGIAITTRNRPELLEVVLRQIKKYTIINHNLIIQVVDDNSKEEWAEINKETCRKAKVRYVRNKKRLGIAKSKNRCLYLMSGCKFIFLFDDDVWPIKWGWEQLYINCHLRMQVQHLVYMFQDKDKPLASHFKPTKNLKSAFLYDHSGGVLLFITNEVLEKVGGFNPEFGLYGYEHVEYSKRINMSGLQNKHKGFLAPKQCDSFLYSLDYHKMWCNIDCEGVDLTGKIRGSMGDKAEVNSSIQENFKIYAKPIKKIYQEIKKYEDIKI